MPAHKASVPAACVTIEVGGWWFTVGGLWLAIVGLTFEVCNCRFNVCQVYRTSAVGVIGGGVEEHVRCTLDKGSKH